MPYKLAARNPPADAVALWTKIDSALCALIHYQPWDAEWGDAFDKVDPEIQALSKLGYGYQLAEPLFKLGGR